MCTNRRLSMNLLKVMMTMFRLINYYYLALIYAATISVVNAQSFTNIKADSGLSNSDQEFVKINDKNTQEMPHLLMPQTCESNGVSTLNGYEVLDHSAYLDLPDPVTSRITANIEDSLILKLARGGISTPLTKTYCQMGVTRLVVDFTHPLEDDALSHQSLRSIYRWVIEGESAGWQIVELGEIFICARQHDSETGQCR